MYPRAQGPIKKYMAALVAMIKAVHKTCGLEEVVQPLISFKVLVCINGYY